MDSESIEQIEDFIYLNSTINSDGRFKKKIIKKNMGS